MQDWVRTRLADLEAAGLLRDPLDSEVRSSVRPPTGEPWLDACSNDYLGLGSVPVSRETLGALEGALPGAAASRLVQGTLREHSDLETELASWLRAESALVTSSAFAANVGLIPALVERDCLIVSDALNHASIVDGCRLARGRVVVTPHLDLGAVEAALSRRPTGAGAWVVTEGLFSMDGDSPDLVELRKLCDRFEAGLIVDEAHSLGVVGPSGAGLAASLGLTPDALVAGLGKAVGSQGGVIACSHSLRTLLWNRARSFVFSTAPSPLLCRAALMQVRQAQAADDARARLEARSAELRSNLAAKGLPIPASALRTNGPIVPVVLGSNERAMGAMDMLRSRGILVQAIRPPTVPAGAARLRLTVHADWSDDAVPRLVAGLEAVCGS